MQVLVVERDENIVERVRSALPAGWMACVVDGVQAAREALQHDGARFELAVLGLNTVRGRTMEFVAACSDPRIAVCLWAYAESASMPDIVDMRLCGAVRLMTRRSSRSALREAFHETQRATQRYRQDIARVHGEVAVGQGVRARSLEVGAAAFNLTPALADVAGLLSDGRSNADIRHELELSPSALKRRLERLYKVLGVRSRHEVAWVLTTEPQEPNA